MPWKKIFLIRETFLQGTAPKSTLPYLMCKTGHTQIFIYKDNFYNMYVYKSFVVVEAERIDSKRLDPVTAKSLTFC